MLFLAHVSLQNHENDVYERHLTLPIIGKMEFQSLAVESLSSALPMQAAVSRTDPTGWTAVASLSIEAIWFI